MKIPYEPTGDRYRGRPDYDELRDFWEAQDDGLNAARGIFLALILGFLFWALVAAAVIIGWNWSDVRHPDCAGLTADECIALHQGR